LIINSFYDRKDLLLIYKNLITSHKNQLLLFAQGGCLEEKIGRQIRRTPWTNMWEVACYFEYKFLNFDNQFFLSSKTCTFIYHKFDYKLKRNQPLLFAQGGCLEEKNR